MIKLKDLLGPPSLKYHLDNGLSLNENVYRYSSNSFVQLFKEARQAHREGKIQVSEEDRILLEQTDLGEYGEYEGRKVPLDLPMMYKQGEVIVCKKCKHSWEATSKDPNPALCHSCGYDNITNVYDMEALEAWKSIQEADYHGKEVALNKPKRGGSKKFYVYTKNKKGNVVKVSFGGTTGLNVKIDNPEARASFAARHQCDTKKDKTKPGYWSCNIGRYAKSLGMKKNFSGYW